MDEALNRAKTHILTYEIVTQEPGKAERKLAEVVYLKGESRLTEFTAPADMKGTKVLVLSASQIYVYLPAFGKVRRIASGTGGGFMGMTFGLEDFATRFSDKYTGAIAGETAGEITLVATARPQSALPYAKIEMRIAKDKMLPVELKYFNAAGVHLKTEQRAGYSCQGKICMPAEQKMIDQTKAGAWTRMIRKSWKVNEPISDDVFSKRALEK